MQFDVYRNPDRLVADSEPYVVDLQHDFLSSLRSVVAAPLLIAGKAQEVSRLTPIVAFDGRNFMLKTYDMVSYPRNVLAKPLGSIANSRDAIIAATDFLFTGV